MFRSIVIVCASVAWMNTGTAATAAEPVVGRLRGLELCIQEICGHAVFLGDFQGTVDGSPAIGLWAVVANHGPDPASGEIGPLPQTTGESTNVVGEWELEVLVLRGFRLRRQTFGGEAVGVLVNRGDNDRPVDNFDVQAVLFDDGTTFGFVDGILRHDRFPPTINLTLTP
jgi:hypothetical protein